MWVGRPLLGQWVADVQSVLEWLAIQPNRDTKRTALIGLGQAGLVALTAAALLPDRVSSVATVDAPGTLITSRAYPPGTHMGLLAPGLLTVGDVPHLAALLAPRSVIIADARGAAGDLLPEADARKLFAFTRTVFQAHRADAKFALHKNARWEALISGL